MNGRALALFLLVPSAALAGDSWTGKTVILTEFVVEVVDGTTDADGNLVPVARLSQLRYRVEDEEGDFIKVREGGKPGWFPKHMAVPAEDAVEHFTQVIKENPAVAEYYNRRGEAYLYKHDYDAAAADYREAVRLRPKERAYHNNLGRALSEKKDYDAAIAAFTESIRLAPAYAFPYANRAAAYAAKQDYGRAVEDYNKAIRLNPNAAVPFNNLAWIQATCPVEKFRDGKAAIENAKKACELTVWKSGSTLDTLAAAYAEAGQFDEAVKWEKKAIEDKEADKESGKNMRSHLQLYEQKKPYRDAGTAK